MQTGPLTICPYCGCGCGLYLHVEDDAAVGTSPSLDHPVNRGSLCIKGFNVHQFVSHPDRLKTPYVRKGGGLVEAGWDEALDFAAEEMLRIKKTYGPDSIGILSSSKCTNEENYLLMKLARATLGTNNIDNCARL